MCGIVGYAGYRQALDVVIDGLGGLEYRGYDSSGVAVVADGKLAWAKRAGKLGNLKAALAGGPALPGTVGVGHTRWATHGAPTDPNAHPHTDCGGYLAVVHNGIIENFAVLRAELELLGHELDSETDTELVAHLLEEEMAAMPDEPGTGAPPPGSLAVAMRAACGRLAGVFTLVAVDVRDPEAVVDYFMLKEIAEQPRAIADALAGRAGSDGLLALDEMRLSGDELREVDKVIVVACGTAYHAGMIAKYAIEHWGKIPCEVELASEFRYRDPILTRSTLVVAISQSGETMDTLMAVRHAREQRCRVIAICNVTGSSIPRESDAVLYTRAGPVIAVALTKAFLTQPVACYLLALYLAQVRGTLYGDEVGAVLAQLDAMPHAVQQVLTRMALVRAVARELAGQRCVLFLGRHVGYPVALEGALKLKELAYMHAEGFAAGELKHGPIALIEDGLPVVVDQPRNLAKSVTVE